MKTDRKNPIASLLCSVLGLWLTGLSSFAMAVDIRVVGMFEQRALLEINGKQHFLRVGENSPEGVKLVEATSKQITVDYRGKRDVLGLSQHIASQFSQASQAEVNLLRDDRGHYFANGTINGYPVDFMVDTGASSIALNSQEAKHLNLKLDNEQTGTASTAGGMVRTYRVVLGKVTVGGITHYNIPAAVIEGDYPQDILLGNSFLSKVEMTERNGVMVLREK